MKLHDLKSMQVVETKDLTRYLVVPDVVNPQGVHSDYLFLSETGWMNSQSYNEDLTLKGCPDSPFTINKVYDRTNPYTHGKHCGPHSLNDSLEDDLVLVWDRNSALDIVEDLERVVETDAYGSKEVAFY